MAGEKIIELKDVFFSYGKEWVLENINLCINKGDCIAVFGPNGGGKTTLLKILLGLLKPQKGKVIYHKKCEIGYLPQIQRNIHFPIKVIELVLMGLANSKKIGFLNKRKDIEKAEQALKRVDMEKFKDATIHELSGGQLQRVYLARALVSDPEVLVLDEPTSNIDVQARFCFYEFLEKLGNDMTLIMVSHDLSLSVTRINKIACVNKRLIISDTLNFNRDMLRLIYGEHLDHNCPVTPYFEVGKVPFINQNKVRGL